MFSRLSLRSVQILPTALRGVQNTSTSSAADQRPKRLLNPGPVRHGFIPEEWFTFFYPKTGATGPYVFLTTLSTYLLSKEYYVLEHEFYNAITFVAIWIFIARKVAPKVGTYLDKEIDKYEDGLNAGRVQSIETLENAIKEEKGQQWVTEVQNMIADAKRENILMQLEATYRERMAQVHSEVKKRLDFHVNIDAVERRMAHKHMVQWITSNVMKSITPDLEKATIQQCIGDLQALSKA